MSRFTRQQWSFRFNILSVLAAILLALRLLYAQAPGPATNVSVNGRAPVPTITLLSPTSGATGSSVTITGTGFAATQGSGTVTFNGVTATATSWSSLSITATVPATATTGLVVVTQNGFSSTGTTFTVTGGGGGGATPCSDAAGLGQALYIRQGASGANNGSDWTNAFSTPPSTLVRGKTYCVADTTTGFGQWTISSHPASGTTYTHIIKATVADHGTATGWVNTFGDGQAIFSASGTLNGGATFHYTDTTGYLEINGNGTPATCGSQAALSTNSTSITTRMASQTGCGFKFMNTQPAGTDGGHAMNWEGGGTHAIVKYVELQGVSGTSTTGTTLTGEAMGLAAWGGGFDSGLFQYGYIHNNVTQIDTLGTNATVDHTYVVNSRNNGGGAHSNVWFVGGGTNGQTLSFSLLENYDDEGVLITYFSDGNSSNILLNSNVFYSPSGTNARGVEIRQNDSGSPLTNTNIRVVHNTFTSLSLQGIYDRTKETNAANTHCVSCLAENNISVNAPNFFVAGGDMTQLTNTDDSTTSRFVLFGGNWHLVGALLGTSGLSSPFNLDIPGNTRGADGGWDRGAYEFCAGGCTNP